jgi:hypothetical protein
MLCWGGLDGHSRISIPESATDRSHSVRSSIDHGCRLQRAPNLYDALGLLKSGKVCEVPTWLVLDHSNKCGEVRRIDGLSFGEMKTPQASLPQRKAHTLEGSNKRWPIGLSLPEDLAKTTSKFMREEGRPDLLAVYHLKL